MIATKAGATLLGDDPPALPRPAVLVTGASSGIGYATAIRLARRGTIVFAGVRRQSDAETIAREGGINVRPLILDITDSESIVRAKTAISRASDVSLVGLVNNAGVAIAGPLEVLPIEALRRQFDVNFFGTIETTQAFLPALRETGGRIVNVSSIGGKLAAPFVGAYASSKFALEAASDALRVELRPFGVAVALIEPGAVKTPIWSRSADTSLRLFDALPPAARLAYDDMIRNMQRVAQQMEKRGIPPERVAAAIERALFAARPRARYLVGTDARLRLLVAHLPDGLRDRIVAAFVGAPRPKREAPPSKAPQAVAVGTKRSAH
jgi:NAD(P)-dependent dehydrogenase (short-subunit alcohol dehydrogenase family)